MADEDRDHVLWECELYEEDRLEMMEGICRAEPGPVYFGDLVSSEANFKRLRKFAASWHDKRSAAEKAERVAEAGTKSP